VGSGSTGDVWEARFDNCDRMFAVKIVEMLHPLMRNAENDFVTSSMFTSPWKRNIDLGVYAIASPRAAMGRLRMIVWISSSLIYVMAL
jgi:hypothetical protein